MSGPTHGSVIYVTADGLLEPLGFSQVVRIVEALALRGWRYEIVSLEKQRDLNDESRLRDLKRRLAGLDVPWRYVPYVDGGGGGAAFANERALFDLTHSRVLRGGVRALHARAYHGGFVALSTKLAAGIPYLFDARSYWFDERLEEGRWFTSPLRLAIARGVEHQLFAQAAGVVTLTELQAEDVRRGAFGPLRGRPVQCITTCADFDDFQRRVPDACVGVPAEIRARLSGRRVLGLVGSLNRSYLTDESLALAREVLRRADDTHLLILSRQSEEYRRLLGAAGIPSDRVTIAAAAHESMPQWLSLIHWGLLLLRAESPAKRASMPTKFAEFLACGVRPIQYGANDEFAEWGRTVGSGVLLSGVTAADLSAAAETIAKSPVDSEVILRGRERAAEHFSLAAGIEKYDTVLRTLFGDFDSRPVANEVLGAPRLS